MTDSTQTPASVSKSPTHFAYTVRERTGGENVWTRLGSAWPTAKGNGFNLLLEAFPLDGRITILLATEKSK